jgi:hypothetical protein
MYAEQKITGEPRAWPGLRLLEPGGPTDRFSVLFPLLFLMAKAESSFRNIVIL